MRHAPALALLVLLALPGCGDEKETIIMVPAAGPTPIPGLGTFWHKALGHTASPGPTQSPPRSGHVSLVYNGKMWQIAGQSGSNVNDVWNSTDGVTWTQVLANNAAPGPNQIPQNYAAAGVVYAGAMWFVGGERGLFRNEVWKSTDGVTWTNVLADNGAPGPNQFPRRRYHAMTVHAGAMWVIGGQGNANDLNDAWSSTDGVTWTNVLTDNAAPTAGQFSRREVPAVLSYGGALWLTGGIDASNALNDVWNSLDGTTWTKVLADSAVPAPGQFPRRLGHSMVILDGRMWVIAGSTAFAYLNDVWSSADGIHWDLAAAGAAFPARYTFGGLVHNNQIWVIGGNNTGGGGGDRNDVWYSP